MADMLLEYRIMPENGEVESNILIEKTKEIIENYDFSVKIIDIKLKEVGFGLKAVWVRFQINETKGSENLENSLKESEFVGDVTVELMDRL